MDEAKLKVILAVIFDRLRIQEAGHPLLVAGVEHYRDIVNADASVILAELKGKGIV